MAPDDLPPALPAAYTELAPLAHGAWGRVWRARHATYGPVAVKLLAPELGGDPEAAWRFGQEFRRLAALELAAVPRAYEQGLTADGTPYFAMALAPGAPPVAPLADVRPLLRALAKALAGLHAAGLVHGDLKRENVVVGEPGVMLVDLALAMPIGAPREGFTGTPAYLAPEAWRGAAYAPEADWYALGVLGYELLTGHPPFMGDAADLARAHLTQAPAPVDDVVMALIAKDPAARRAGVAMLGVQPATPRGLRPGDLLERDLPDAPWQAALAVGGTVWLVGSRGSGKTRVLDRWRLEAQQAGRAWLAVGASDAAPGASLRALLRRALAAARLAPGPSAAWLAGGLPTDWQELEPPARRRAIARAVATDLAAALAVLGPTVIALDDADGADETSRDLLAGLRADPAFADTTWVLAVVRADEGPSVPIPAWQPEELVALAETRLGGPLAPGVDTVIALQANPAALQRSLARWLAGELLVEGPAGWFFDPAAGSHEAPPPIEPALAARLTLAWGVGGLPVAAADPVALDRLVASGFAIVRDGLARPTDPDAAAAAFAPLDLAARRQLAAELAREIEPVAIAARLALEAHDMAVAAPLVKRAVADALAEWAVKEARMLLAALPPVPGDLELAWLRGEAARLADDLDGAIAAYDEAIGLADAQAEPVLAARARIGRAKAHQMRGRYEPAAADLTRAEADARDLAPLVAARAAVAAGRVAYFRGEPAAALAACARAVAIARATPDHAVVLSAALNLEGALLAETDPARATEARAKLEEALALADAAGDRQGHGAALENLGNVHLAAGELHLARDAFEAYEAACDTATERTSARMNRALALAALGDPQAPALGAAVAAEALERGRPFIASLARLAEGEGRWRQADFAGAWAVFDEALALATDAGNRYAESLVRRARLEAAGVLGDRTLLETELASLPESPETRAAAGLARANLARWQGDVAAAEAHAGPLAAHPDRALALRALMLLGEVGGPDAAARFAAAAAIAESWGSRWHLEAAWLGLARTAGQERADAWLARILDGDVAAGNPLARAGAAALRHSLKRAAGPTGLAALARWRETLEALPAPLAASLALHVGAAAAPAMPSSALEPQAAAAWLAAIGLADDEHAVYDALLSAVLQLAGMARGYLLAYRDGRLASIATRQLDLAAELADGFSSTIADEALITGEPVYVLDAAGSERFGAAASVVALGLHSVVAVPVATPTTMLGVVYADRTAIDPILGQADLALLRMLAAAAAERVLALRAEARARAAERWLAGLPAVMAAASRGTALVAIAELAGADAARWGEQVAGKDLAFPAWTDHALQRPPGLVGQDGDGARWLAVIATPRGPLALAGPGPEPADGDALPALAAPVLAALTAVAP